MSLASKTGLLASPKKRILRLPPSIDIDSLTPCAVARQVHFSLRPFGGLYNPYSHGCSILCNHPAALELKNVVKQAKEAWIIEGKAFLHRDETSSRGYDRTQIKIINPADLPEHIPEEFYRRYTDTDSRPLTPTPTVASGRTRNSAGGSLLNARRCVTPEPTCSNVKERKQLILDLRRSHSQETLYWNASSELSPGGHDSWVQPSSSILSQPKSTAAEQVKKKPSKPPILSLKNEPEILIEKENSQICINARDDDNEDEDQPRRRGKKRKKNKTESALTTTFHPSQDPETQIATIGPDSPNLSNRPSLIPNGHGTIPSYSTQSNFHNFNFCEDEIRSCFLDEDSLMILKRGLNLDVVENTFEIYLHRALKEAYRTLTPEQLAFESDAIKSLREYLNIPEMNHDKWLNLPRKYSRSWSRFELPLDSRELGRMNPIQYLSLNVDVSKSLKLIYRRIFLRNLPKDNIDTEIKTFKKHDSFKKRDLDSDDEVDDTINSPKKIQTLNEIEDRLLPFSNIDSALHEVLGFHGNKEKIDEIKQLLGLGETDVKGYNFRTWCGIIAFSERYLNGINRDIDPPNEIEIADFESLERKLKCIHLHEKLENVLNLIKYN